MFTIIITSYGDPLIGCVSEVDPAVLQVESYIDKSKLWAKSST